MGRIMRVKRNPFTKIESRSLHVLGVVLLFTSLLMIPALAVAIWQDESTLPFLIPVIPCVLISSALMIFFKNPKVMRPVDGIVMIITLWAGLFVVGTIPYLIYGLSFVDAIFESVSGFTTAGATILPDVASLPQSMLLWRALTQWVGGIIIVTMFMFIMPMVVSGGRSLLQNEMSGSGSGNLYLKMESAAKQYVSVYVILTAAFFVILMLLGLSWLEASTISLCVICTGGFMITSDSFASYGVLVKVAVMIFMLISATNFYLQYKVFVKREFGAIRKNEEFRFMVLFFSAVSALVLVAMFMNGRGTGNVLESVVDVLFSVVSIGTTTGFTTVDYTTGWPFIGMSLLLVVMFIGGSTGSTAGGIKISRALIVLKSMLNEVRQAVHPNAVYSVRFDGRGADEGVVRSATVVALMFIITIFVGAMVMDMEMEMGEALFASCALVSGTGPGMGALFGNYCAMSGGMKLFSCGLMFLGRVEIVAILVIFTKGFWKELLGISSMLEFREKVLSVPHMIVSRIIRKKDDATSDDIGPEPEQASIPKD